MHVAADPPLRQGRPEATGGLTRGPRPDAGRLAGALGGRFGRPLRVLESTGSTNDDALAWALEGAPEGALVVARHQRSGRGRRGRRWVSEPGRALALSLVLRPDCPAESLGLLTAAVGLAAAEAIEERCGLEPGLEWPNDVVVGGRKLAGVLVESRTAGGMVPLAVAGVGINLLDPLERSDEMVGRATSIEAELARAGRPPGCDPEALVTAWLRRMESLLPLVLDHAAAADLAARVSARSETLGREVVVRRADGRVVEGLATAILPSGKLAIEHEGASVTLESGEIERLRPR